MYLFDCITVHIGIALAARALNSSNAFCNHALCAHRRLMDQGPQVKRQKVYSTALATAARDHLDGLLTQTKLPVPSNVRLQSGCVTVLRSSLISLCQGWHEGLLNTLGALMGFMLEMSFGFEIV
jgi:hypothetical protein